MSCNDSYKESLKNVVYNKAFNAFLDSYKPNYSEISVDMINLCKQFAKDTKEDVSVFFSVAFEAREKAETLFEKFKAIVKDENKNCPKFKENNADDAIAAIDAGVEDYGN